ncbi:MAG: arsenate reductase/protein-tyrosine-phosphatase family protein [Gammaproteobacteria bacterium]
MTPAILFVCTGNICRSPMAAGLFALQLGPAAASWRIDSAGLHALEGHAPDPLAVAAAAELGADISAARGRQLTAADFRDFDHIVPMDYSHYDFLTNVQPPETTAAIAMLERATGASIDVADPYGRAARAFRRAARLINEGVEVLAARLLA